MPIFTNFREILQIKSEFTFANFPNTLTTYHMGNLFYFIFLTFPSFSFIFLKLKRRSKGVEFENGTFSTGSWHEPGLKVSSPLVPVRASNRD